MGLSLFTEATTGNVVFVCDTSDVAFGPVMDEDFALPFAASLGVDPRRIPVDELVEKYHAFVKNAPRCKFCDAVGDEYCDSVCQELHQDLMAVLPY